MPHTVALTGATGFLGRVVVRHLAAAGWNIRALARAKSNTRSLQTRSLQKIPVDWVSGSLEDSSSLKTLVEGVDTVIHCAGVVRGASQTDFDSVNHQGFCRLIDVLCSGTNPPSILYVSSLAAREPQLSWYAASKYAGEQALQSATGGLSWRVLRPPAIYGPEDRELLPLFKSMRLGFAPVLGNPSARLSLIYVDDVASAILHCLASQDTTQHRLLELHDGHQGGYNWQDIRLAAEAVYSRRIRQINVPETLLSALASGNLTLARLFGYSPMLTPGKVREITHSDWVCDNEQICQLTDWSPKVTFAEGLKRTWPC